MMILPQSLSMATVTTIVGIVSATNFVDQRRLQKSISCFMQEKSLAECCPNGPDDGDAICTLAYCADIDNDGIPMGVKDGCDCDCGKIEAACNELLGGPYKALIPSFVPGFDDACEAVYTCCDGETIDNDTFNTCIDREEVDIDFKKLFGPEGALDLPDCEEPDVVETTEEAKEGEVLAGIIEEDDVGSMPLMRKLRKRVG